MKLFLCCTTTADAPTTVFSEPVKEVFVAEMILSSANKMLFVPPTVCNIHPQI
jgi:hypothetical protein